MKQQGFTLIEVLIATTLAGILSASLLVIWTNMNQIKMRIDRYVSLYQRATLIHMQLDRDLSGAFLPVEADMSQARLADMMTTPSTAPAAGQKPAPVPSTQQPPSQMPAKLEKPFFADQTLSELTFVTNNIMQRYWSAKVAALSAAQPRIARIVYKLIPDKKHADSFVLMRTESSQIYLAQLEKSGARAYQIADGIRSVRMQYGVYVEKPEQKSGAQKQEAAPVFERKVVSEWKKIEDQKPPWPLIPEWVTMELELWDAEYKHTHTYTFEFYIYPRFDKQKPNQRSAGVRPVSQPIKSPMFSSPVPPTFRGATPPIAIGNQSDTPVIVMSQGSGKSIYSAGR